MSRSEKRGREGEATKSENTGTELWLTGYSTLQAYFLTRLEGLLERCESYQASSDSDPEGLRLLHRAIYSTLQDCIQEGIGQEARLMIHNE